MNFSEYQERARTTAIYREKVDGHLAQAYPILGLSGEVGELANKFKKVLRDGAELDLNDLAGELGDILWYLALVIDEFDLRMEHVAQKNLSKLQSRQERGVIGGSGDNR